MNLEPGLHAGAVQGSMADTCHSDEVRNLLSLRMRRMFGSAKLVGRDSFLAAEADSSPRKLRGRNYKKMKYFHHIVHESQYPNSGNFLLPRDTVSL